ncbi:MAG: relaxase [Pseudomonadota bacterium]
MILIGNSRGGARDLALHLMKDENDHVEVHDLRGFAADDLQGALHEAYAVSRGTKCKQFLFSLSLNPPKDEEVSTESFESAIDRAEVELGLDGQPRAIVFHEKEGRRHAHAVWSRIDAETMTAKQLSFHKNKLQDVSRELYHEHGWRMPDGLADRSRSDPRNFTLEQWQQAKRQHRDPREIKTALADAWSISDSRAAFEHALQERGYWLAKGDRRGFTALDIHGEVYSIPRWAGVQTKAVRERLGDESELSSVDETKARIAGEMDTTLARLQQQQEAERRRVAAEYQRQREELVEKQRAEREAQMQALRQRQDQEQAERQARFRRGLAGLWDRLRGEHRRLTEQNALEAQQSAERDRRERDQTSFLQLEQRRQISLEATRQRLEAQRQQEELERDRERYAQMVAQREAQAESQRQTAQREQERQAQARAPPATQGADNMSAEFNRQAVDRAARLEEFKQRREQERSQAQQRDNNDLSHDR